MILGYVLNVHTALSGRHDHRTAFRTIEQNAHVVFLRLLLTWIINILSNQHLIDFLTFWTSLMRYQRSSQYRLHFLWNFVHALGEHYSTRASLFDFSLSTTTGM